jgi:hypothetical protein
MTQTSFNIDKETGDALAELKKVFGVSSNAAVLKRALALARLNARNADKNENVTIRRPDGREMVVPLKF